jgi:hypothetical protein
LLESDRDRAASASVQCVDRATSIANTAALHAARRTQDRRRQSDPADISRREPLSLQTGRVSDRTTPRDKIHVTGHNPDVQESLT